MKKIKNIALVFLGMTILSSCNDYLDETPDNRTILDSPEAVSELLVSAYPEAFYHGFAEVMSDNAGDKGIGQYVAEYIPNENAYYWEDAASSQYDTPTMYWNACYAAIAAANHALDAIEKASDEENYTAQKGEALAARAYAHFMLVNLFAKHYNPATAENDLGVPFVEAPEKVVFKDYKRATVKTIYDRIEADIEEADKLIRDDSYAVGKYHFTQAALHAFASRFYLFKGDWDKVIEHSDMVLGSDPSSKLRDWNGKYLTYEASELWAQYTKAEEASNIMLARGYSNWGNGAVVFRYSLSSLKIQELFGKDPITDAMRFEMVIGDKVLYAAGSQLLGFIPKLKGRIESHDNNPDQGLANMVAPLFTTEEVLFNRAEAYAMKKDYASVLEDLDSYLKKRVRSYNPENKVTLEKIQKEYEMADGPELAPYYTIEEGQKYYLWYVLDLRRREFVHEGMRWFDVKRFNIEITHDIIDGSSITLSKDDNRRVIQIPEQAIAIGLQANPR
ncbi:RagB/SusD family nutrient uptake outer membrane protein [Marinifilum fragile]|uniref:RagB/SusD family nutrient uptake outer membrane protein n=1 Tax=Marinifilum fragile TaxID=570161 RepID=UPI0009FB8900|nr:RagB/SusD family nutrient uptake outer membrane protein [Marinifilum fragile]